MLSAPLKEIKMLLFYPIFSLMVPMEVDKVKCKQKNWFSTGFLLALTLPAFLLNAHQETNGSGLVTAAINNYHNSGYCDYFEKLFVINNLFIVLL